MNTEPSKRHVALVRALLTLAPLMLGVSLAHAQVASPTQSGHYAPGVINIRDYTYPPPGLFVLWYNWAPWSDTYIDRDGNELSSINLSQLDPTLPDVDVSLEGKAFATVPVVAWASHFTLLGGGRFLAMISPTYAVANYTVVTDPSGAGFDTTATRVTEGSVSGFSDLFVSPLGFSWALGPADVTLSYGFTAPTGRYSTGAADNIGLGFWTNQFQGFGTFYPWASQSTAIMIGLTYELNGTIKDVDVKPGNRLTFEWGVSQYLNERLELGVQGGTMAQVTDDTGSDVFWDPSYHDRKSILGFSVGYWPWKNRLYLSAKYAFDHDVRQSFKNQSLMLNFLFLTNALTGE